MIIREYRESDTEMIMKLVYNTVHEINICDYSYEQVNAWVGKNLKDMNYQLYHQRFKLKLPYIAEMNNEIVGFAELESNGHIDCFFCHSKYQRQGIGSKLLNHIENIARYQKNQRLYAEVSITAKPFFKKHNFVVIKQQKAECKGVLLTNYVMEKYLGVDE